MDFVEELTFLNVSLLKGTGVFTSLFLANQCLNWAFNSEGIYLLCLLPAFYFCILAVLGVYECWEECANIIPKLFGRDHSKPDREDD